MRFDPSRRPVRGLARLTAALAMLSIAGLAGPAPGHAASPRDALEQAHDLFLVADFSHALEKVDSLLESGVLSGSAERDAWVLKARCEAGLAHRSAAQDAYCEALRVDGSWRPDPDLFTKDEIALFDQAKPNCRLESTTAPSPLPGPAAGAAAEDSGASSSKSWYQKKSTWAIAGGVVVAGILAGVLAGGGGDDGDPQLAGFPPPPATVGVIR